MCPAAVVTASQPLILHLGTLLLNMSDHEYFTFCQLNPEWRIERTEEGDLIIVPPTGGRTGARNFTLTGQFHQWWKQTERAWVSISTASPFPVARNDHRIWPDPACSLGCPDARRARGIPTALSRLCCRASLTIR